MLAIGQKVRIVNYDHPRCGEFGDVVAAFDEGRSASLKLWRFPETRVAVCADQVDVIK
jgi:hypothetical protein